MTITVKKIRQIKSELNANLGKKVCPNCYFTLSHSNSLTEHDICPCCEFNFEMDYSINASGVVSTEDTIGLI
ncbi:hypothetical protein [Vibrio sp. HN007]|uniref:hypothetical protein n=1 Tax=Vibrio iocasae TaxID=3098914 RepID=UPI0035D3E7D8